MLHALSFDIEDWFHIVGIPHLEDRKKWDGFNSIIENKTSLILDILDENETKATFFILGWIAQKYPHLSTKIASAGHEIGTHSYWHRRVYEMRPKEFEVDLSLSIDVLEQQTGQKVKGFRAPSFSIVPNTEWAFEIMAEIGLEYDASLFPAQRAHGGYSCNQQIHEMSLYKGRSLIEFPMSVKKIGPFRVPFSGGGYMRLLPINLIHRFFRNFEEKNQPVVVYLHPRDFGSDQPKVDMPLNRKFKSYVGLNSTERKLRELLKTYDFDTCYNVIGNEVK